MLNKSLKFSDLFKKHSHGSSELALYAIKCMVESGILSEDEEKEKGLYFVSYEIHYDGSVTKQGFQCELLVKDPLTNATQIANDIARQDGYKNFSVVITSLARL